MRKHNTDNNGSSFSSVVKLAVWRKANIVSGVDSTTRRKDKYGAWIDWDKYGTTQDGGYGWEIDHIKPVAHYGTDDLDNLQPLQWQNNRGKGDTWPPAVARPVVART
jgi:5-methylcytosine-specific restriction endonuclease McrA